MCSPSTILRISYAVLRATDSKEDRWGNGHIGCEHIQSHELGTLHEVLDMGRRCGYPNQQGAEPLGSRNR